RHRLTTSHALNGQAIEDVIRRNGSSHGLQAPGLPPVRMAAEQGPGALSFELGADPVRQFLVDSLDNDTLPAIAFGVADLKADFRVVSHPVDLLAGQGKAVDGTLCERDRDRNDVRLVIARASQVPHPRG